MRKIIFTFMCLLVIASVASAELVGGYIFDGDEGTGNPATVPDIGGDTSVDLTLGSTAIYNADTPFAYEGNTSLDVAFPNERAYNNTTTAYHFELKDDPFSASMWVNFTEDSGWRQVVSQRKASTGNGWFLGITGGSTGANHAVLFTQGTTAGQARSATSTSVLNDGAWHHVVGISDPNSDLDLLGDGEIFMYVDGNLETTYKKTQTEASDYGNSVFAVGTGADLSTGTYNRFTGLIDEVAVYNHALTGVEVLALFNATLPIPGGLLEGDANRDGLVSADDYASVQVHFGDTGSPGLLGDANIDGVVSADDYASVQSNFGATAGMGGDIPVPEPATLSLLVVGGLILIRRVRLN